MKGAQFNVFCKEVRTSLEVQAIIGSSMYRDIIVPQMILSERFIQKLTSVGWGKMTTLIVLVCTLPIPSVMGTRCTRCTPISCLSTPNTAPPLTLAAAVWESMQPLTYDTFHKRRYMCRKFVQGNKLGYIAIRFLNKLWADAILI